MAVSNPDALAITIASTIKNALRNGVVGQDWYQR